MNRTAILTGVGVIVVGAALTAWVTPDAAPLPAPVAATDYTDVEKAAFGARVRSYLLENPEVIFEAAAVMEQRQQEMQSANDTDLIAANSEAIFDDGHSWVGGNPEGDVTLVEFMDYRCGYCRRAFPEVEELIESDGNIRVIIKEFPILGDESTLAARFAIAAQQVLGAEAYKSLHDAMMTYNGEMSQAGLVRLAETLDLDAGAITAHMDSDEVSDVIEANRALGQTLQITGTPSFVIDDRMLRGYVPLEGMREIVADIRG
jgi:protein-disulfide isomerase